MTPIRVLRTLFQVRDQAHFLHLKTTSYAEHKALNEFYDGWLDLADSFVETYQGKYGRIEGAETIEINGSANLNAFMASTMDFLNKDIMTLYDKTVDSDLDNIVADMKGLVNKTCYLLTLK